MHSLTSANVRHLISVKNVRAGDLVEYNGQAYYILSTLRDDAQSKATNEKVFVAVYLSIDERPTYTLHLHKNYNVHVYRMKAPKA